MNEVVGIPDKIKGSTILVAEDEDINWQFLKHFLEERGANVICARNGAIAVEQIINNREIDLVLMDIRMPVMDGIEATKRIKEVSPNTPIIVQTAFDMSGEEDNYKENGFDDFLTKPLDCELLVKKVNQWLNK